ncbi:ribonuclease T2-like protein [Pseudomassariella vexata]|uniref:ribonuclease T2 n=1 Tax=Pseudomassariella vexata TaxID=1141098 RepID=A0A1Y2DVA7_9PEZI|nr:ribonuclease T2-like protein [Pseudomassariella vexata]ORY63220.1 ribonuclease T2-like protein [Pseudomassariella vexata]
MSTARRAALSLVLLSQQVLAGLYNESTVNHTCALSPPVLSCSSGAVPGLVDTCCTETYGGLLISTQIWDTYTGLETSGQVLPKDTWTLHGLWPDFCNGSYTQYCDLSRQYDPLPSPNTTTGTPAGEPVLPYTGPGIGTFLEPFAKWDLLAYMNKYWVAQNQPNQDFWAHEFSKHATCYSTFDVECYGPQYVEHEEVVDFFETALLFYNELPTWKWLSAAGIEPINSTSSKTKSYKNSNSSSLSLSQVQDALIKGFGKIPYIACAGPRYNATEAGAGSSDDGYTVLTEVWYYYHVLGKPQRGQGVTVDANSTGGSVSNCANTPGALKYYERTPGSEA